MCVDDLHVIAGDEAWEEALFHCFNRIRQANGRLLISSRKRLSALNLGLPDLASRLAWGLRLPLLPLDDSDKLAVINTHSNAPGSEFARRCPALSSKASGTQHVRPDRDCRKLAQGGFDS